MSKSNFSADQCQKCAICNTVCPVYAVNPDYPGPKFIGPEAARLRDISLGKKAEYCLGCRQCEIACPNGVEITHLALEIKEKWGQKDGVPLRDWFFGQNELVSRIASLVPTLTNFLLGSPFLRNLGEKILGIKNKPFPVYKASFAPHPLATGKGNIKAAYFTGCYARYNGTDIAHAVIKILEKCGVEVLIPPQKCCGVPALSNGMTEKARENAEFNLKVLSELAGKGYFIVASCPSCTMSLKQEYKTLLNSSFADNLASRVYDVSEFLLNFELLNNREFYPFNKRYFYHQPCHTKVQGIGSPAETLLRLIPQLTIVGGEQKCCGQAGTYGFKKEKYEISAAVGAKLFQDVLESRAEGAITECGMCSLQLACGTGKDVYHPVQVLNTAIKENL